MRTMARQGLIRIEALDEECLVALHLREIVPAVPGIMGDGIVFAHPICIDQFAGNEILGPHAGGIANGQGLGLERPADRPPYVDLDKSMSERVARLFGRQEIAHAIRS